MAPKPELNAVIYALYHLRDLDDVRRNDYAYNVYHKFVHEFDNELQQRIIRAIEETLTCEDIDSCFALPKVPGSNATKREYLQLVLQHLKAGAVSALRRWQLCLLIVAVAIKAHHFGFADAMTVDLPQILNRIFHRFTA